jgi:hypothetical protein
MTGLLMPDVTGLPVTVATIYSATVFRTESSSDLAFDECRVGVWVDTEGNIHTADSIRVRVVQKEIEPLEQYCAFVSTRFRVNCIVRQRRGDRDGKVIKEYQADHVASAEFLDAIEPYIETAKKRRQIAKARILLAYRGFKRLFPVRSQRLSDKEKQRRHRTKVKGMAKTALGNPETIQTIASMISVPSQAAS